MASLFIKDPTTAELVDRLAKRRGTTKTEAVRRAVEAELAKDKCERSVKERLDDFYRRFPPLIPTELKADKAFFDDLSGE